MSHYVLISVITAVILLHPQTAKTQISQRRMTRVYSLLIRISAFCKLVSQNIDFFCRRHYKVKFDIDTGYILQTALIISLS